MYITLENKTVRTAVDGEKADLFAAIMLRRLGGEVNYMKLMKLLYFAERFHLRRYMRPIAKDDLLAMKRGMVGSYWLNILRGIGESRFFTTNKEKFTVKLRNNVEIEENRVLSKSEIEALDFSLDNFGKYNENELVEIIHQYPEWEKFKDRFLGAGGVEDVDFRDILNDPHDNPAFRKYKFKDPFKPISVHDKEVVEKAIAEYAIESM